MMGKRSNGKQKELEKVFLDCIVTRTKNNTKTTQWMKSRNIDIKKTLL